MTCETENALVALCIANGIFPNDTRPGPDEDLVESGFIDSMGLLAMQCLIDENYGVSIPAVVFAVELRTINGVARYLDAAAAGTAGHLEQLPSAPRS